MLLDRLLGEPGRPARIVDLLFHLPHGGISRELKGSIAQAPVGETVTLKVRVTEHRPGPPRRGKAPFRILVEDDTGDILLVFFNAHPERIQALLPVGSVRYVSGKIEIWDGYRQMVHPDRILDERRIGELPAVEAVYGLTEGLSTRLVGKFVGAALAPRAGAARMAGPGLSRTEPLPRLRRGAAPASSPGCRRRRFARGRRREPGAAAARL